MPHYVEHILKLRVLAILWAIALHVLRVIVGDVSGNNAIKQ